MSKPRSAGRLVDALGARFEHPVFGFKPLREVLETLCAGVLHALSKPDYRGLAPLSTAVKPTCNARDYGDATQPLGDFAVPLPEAFE